MQEKAIAVPVFMILLDARTLSERLMWDGIAGVVDSPYFPGQKIDMNDGQLKSFLEAVPYVTIVAFFFVFLRKLLNFIILNRLKNLPNTKI